MNGANKVFASGYIGTAVTGETGGLWDICYILF
jgi:hypothetical protein